MIAINTLPRICFAITFLFILLTGCEADTHDPQNVSFVTFRLGGPTINGDTRIEEDGNLTTLDVRATIFPGSGTSPEFIQLVYSDNESQKIFTAHLTTVPQTAPYSVEKGSPFAISVYDGINRYSMSTSLISMHITKLELEQTQALGTIGIKEIEANFTGKVLYKDLNNPSAEELEHHIDGNLYYKSEI